MWQALSVFPRGLLNGWTIPLVAGILFMGVACGTSHDSENEPTGQAGDATNCRDECEMSLWPNVIVDVIPPGASELEDTDAAKVVIFDPEGNSLGDPDRPRTHNCPQTQPPHFFCSYGFYTNPSLNSVVVHVEDRWGHTIEERVPLQAHSYCARDITFIRVFVSASEQPRLEHPGPLNPCNSFEY